MQRASNGSAAKVDRRTLKTKKAIRAAFVALLSQKDIGEITITEIADTADINRKTFYNYYKDIRQIVDEVEDEIVRRVGNELEQEEPHSYARYPYRIFKSLTAAVSENLDFYEHLMNLDRCAGLASKLIEAAKVKLKGSLASLGEAAAQPMDLILEYTISGAVAVYQSWFSSGRKQSIEDISRTVGVMALSGLNGLMDANQ